MKFIYRIIDIFLKLVYQSKDNKWVFRLWDFSLSNKIHYFYFSLFFMFLELIFDALEPFSYGKLSQLVAQGSLDFNVLQYKLLPLIIVILLNRVCYLLKETFQNIFSLNYRLNLRNVYYTSILSKDLEFFDNNKSSDLFYILTHDIKKVEYASIIKYLGDMKSIIHCLISFVMLFYLSAKLSLFLCMMIPFIGILENFKNNLVLNEEKKYTAKKKKSHFIVLEALENMRIIKSFSTEDKERKKYEKKLDQMMNIEYKGEMTCLMYECGTLIFVWGTLFYAIKFGLGLIQGNELNVDTFVSFFMLCRNILDNFNDLAYNCRNFLKAEIFTEKIFFVLDYEPKIKSFDPNAITKTDMKIGIDKTITGKITIKNIFFEYPKEKTNEIVTVLKNITLDIYSGMKLGIVGFSGSGKTTLINLIQRLYDVGFCERKVDFEILRKIDKDKDDEDEDKDKETSSTLEKKDKKEIKEKNQKIKNENKIKIEQKKESKENCEILIDDLDIKKYNLKCLHSQIGYVPQEPSLFDGTIRENLIYGLPEAEVETNPTNNKDKYDKEIKWSLNISQADFVFDESKFPLGLDTIVGSKGAKLSGGQKQRIAIARALIKKPKILILDEATSALDSESEAVFQKELFNLKGKMTIIIVSHRLCTIKDCDEIVVINEGKIVEKGKHEELIACRGIYHSLMEKQIENE